jgi:hypothetical protein
MYGVSHEGKYCTFNKILVRKRIKWRSLVGDQKSFPWVSEIFPSCPLTGVRSFISLPLNLGFFVLLSSLPFLRSVSMSHDKITSHLNDVTWFPRRGGGMKFAPIKHWLLQFMGLIVIENESIYKFSLGVVYFLYNTPCADRRVSSSVKLAETFRRFRKVNGGFVNTA